MKYQTDKSTFYFIWLTLYVQVEGLPASALGLAAQSAVTKVDAGYASI